MNDSNMEKSDSREAVIQNLKDAGCSTGIIKDFMASFDGGDVIEQITLLEGHRKQLLNKVHKEEKRISCLDYLVYQIKKNSIEKKEGYL